MPKKHKIEIEGETIYLAKSNFFGWGVIHPNKNEDNSINWKNLLIGGKWLNLIMIILIVIIILGFTNEYRNNAKQYHDLLFLCNQTLQNLDPAILKDPSIIGNKEIIIINKSVSSCNNEFKFNESLLQGGEQ